MLFVDLVGRHMTVETTYKTFAVCYFKHIFNFNCNFSKLQFFQCISIVILLHIFAVKSYFWLNGQKLHFAFRPWSIVNNFYIKLDYFDSLQKVLMLPGSTSPLYTHMIPGPTSLVCIYNFTCWSNWRHFFLKGHLWHMQILHIFEFGPAR